MNRDVFEGKWKQLRGMVKEKWGKLSDDELDTIEGRLDRFAGLLQERYGYARDHAEKEIEAWMNDHSTSRRRGAFPATVLFLLLPALGLGVGCKPRDTASTDEIKVKLSAQASTADKPAADDDPFERGWTTGKRSDDAVITLAVKNRLLEDPEVKGLRIALYTRKGVVYLTGIVRSAAARDRAVRLALETKSVRDVHANLTIAS